MCASVLKSAGCAMGLSPAEGRHSPTLSSWPAISGGTLHWPHKAVSSQRPFHGVRDACPRSIAKLSHHASFSSMVIRPMQCGRHQGDFRGGPGWEFHFCGTESCLNPQCYTDYMGKHLVPAAPLSCEVMKYRYRRGDSSTRKA